MKRILIDIGHPAHIHYFKNCVKILSEKGYKFLFVVRDREATIELIKQLGFDYISRGKGGNGAIGKLISMFKIDFKIWKIARKFKPDLFLSFASPYAAQVAKSINKPHIAFDDTEHAVFSHMLYRPFTDVILSPAFYSAKLHKRQVLFNSYMELCYIHPNYFAPNPEILDELQIDKTDKYAVLRFISWDANHDIGYKGFTITDKINLVKEVEKHYKVFISSESNLPNELERYRLKTHPSKFHDVLAFASLHIGEGATTASESAVLGVPTIYTNPLIAGNCTDEEKYGLLYQITDYLDIKHKINEISSLNIEEFKKRRNKLLYDKIDPTKFMVWFVENYPQSIRITKENSDYQSKFK